MVYDTLIVFALVFIATFILMQVFGGELNATGKGMLQLSAVLIAYLYFGGFWTHGGQTVGMRAWRFRVADPNGASINWQRATLRFLAAILSWVSFGLGFLWALWDKEGFTWHDRLSNSRLVKR